MIDISQWPINKIMQLPDNCFGKRDIAGQWDSIASSALEFHALLKEKPDWILIWDMMIKTISTGGSMRCDLGFRMSESTIANDAQFVIADRLFDDWGPMNDVIHIVGGNESTICFPNLRKPVELRNRNIWVRAENVVAATTDLSITFTISEIPKFIEEWTLSDYQKSRM